MKRVLASMLILGVVGLPLAAQADFVTYNDTKDYYEANAYYNEDSIYKNEASSGTPPVEASISYPSATPLLTAYFKADRYALSATASAKNSGENNSSAWAYGTTTLFFTANSTAPGMITSNYSISIAAADPTAENAYAYVMLRYRLYSGTNEIYSNDINKDTWRDGDINIVDGFFNSGSIDFVQDTEYKLQISIWRCNADYYEGTDYSAYASVNINNIRVNAVPLPSSLLFLGSGLLPLVGWRRFRKS
jgi:hypothetical protein